MENFDFTGDAIDSALRKFLAKVHLPKEVQQIDRVMEKFAQRYHDCNPDLVSSDEAYAIAFSILLLHTDAHNKNVKQKMNKDTFIMRTRLIEGGEKIPIEILDIMYDNVTFSKFTYAEDDNDEQSQLILQNSSGNVLSGAAPTWQGSWFMKRNKAETSLSAVTQTPVNAAELDPHLLDLIPLESPYSYLGTLTSMNTNDIYRAFAAAQSLRVVGVRSKSSESNSNTSNHQADTLSVYSQSQQDNTYILRVVKAGVLERKYDFGPGGKKSAAGARSWRRFGVILSGSQLIFFSDLPSFLIHYSPVSSTVAVEQNSPSSPTSPDSIRSLNSNPLSVNSSQPLLHPSQILSLTDSICIYDRTYAKYPHVFRFVMKDGQQFMLKAENEDEMNDWMRKCNYAATFKTTGIRLRGSYHNPHNRHGHSQSLPGNGRKGSGGSSTIASSRTGVSRDRERETEQRIEGVKAKIADLSAKIDSHNAALSQILRLRKILLVMTPLQKTTRDRLLAHAEVLAKRLKVIRLSLQKLQCYHEVLQNDLIAAHEQALKRAAANALWGHQQQHQYQHQASSSLLDPNARIGGSSQVRQNRMYRSYSDATQEGSTIVPSYWHLPTSSSLSSTNSEQNLLRVGGTASTVGVITPAATEYFIPSSRANSFSSNPSSEVALLSDAGEYSNNLRVPSVWGSRNLNTSSPLGRRNTIFLDDDEDEDEDSRSSVSNDPSTDTTDIEAGKIKSRRRSSMPQLPQFNQALLTTPLSMLPEQLLLSSAVTTGVTPDSEKNDWDWTSKSVPVASPWTQPNATVITSREQKKRSGQFALVARPRSQSNPARRSFPPPERMDESTTDGTSLPSMEFGDDLGGHTNAMRRNSDEPVIVTGIKRISEKDEKSSDHAKEEGVELEEVEEDDETVMVIRKEERMERADEKCDSISKNLITEDEK